MTISPAILQCCIFASLAAVTGLIATAVWIAFAMKITDTKIQKGFLCRAAAIFSLTLSEIVFLQQSIAIKQTELFPSEDTPELEMLEYLRYALIIIGFILLLISSKQQLSISKTYGFSGFSFGKNTSGTETKKTQGKPAETKKRARKSFKY